MLRSWRSLAAARTIRRPLAVQRRRFTSNNNNNNNNSTTTTTTTINNNNNDKNRNSDDTNDEQSFSFLDRLVAQEQRRVEEMQSVMDAMALKSLPDVTAIMGGASVQPEQLLAHKLSRMSVEDREQALDKLAAELARVGEENGEGAATPERVAEIKEQERRRMNLDRPREVRSDSNAKDAVSGATQSLMRMALQRQHWTTNQSLQAMRDVNEDIERGTRVLAEKIKALRAQSGLSVGKMAMEESLAMIRRHNETVLKAQADSAAEEALHASSTYVDPERVRNRLDALLREAEDGSVEDGGSALFTAHAEQGQSKD